jgi:ZIP family zinc transporter
MDASTLFWISRPRHRQAGLLLSALTIHNIPEGLAVGVAFAAGGSDLGAPLALAIGIQNIPRASRPVRRSPPTTAASPPLSLWRRGSSSRPRR